MTALTSPAARLRWTLIDGLTLIGRELSRLRQEPGQIVAALVFPVIMIVLFGYVFGSAIQVPDGGDYREYLMPGLFSMVAFSAWLGVMTRMAGDASRGVMDRFRSMPMARLAVPFGQTGADLLTGVLMLAVMVGAGLLVGWQPHRGLLPAAEAFLLMILLRYALGWVGVYVGLLVRNDQVANALVPLGLPFTMVSNAFVPTDGMPAWLRFVADWNPVSALTAASRQLFGNPGAPSGEVSWPLAHPVAAVLLWSAALLVIFVPLSLRAHMRRGR
ncbi:ABC transporter permease [Nonomuraea gerenzanensis]|uniref:Transport permease protein n=1 Tax=Nonomuraea gerenzanensis TaxID=93944 RepID=A0A1M4EDV7_9ACTN|nr:ABC transporter permease [Nonomuraea gerenzanensis]UBU08511.1 ABC transporter permease [Nonomuraea gerenzanensis]SBO96858.1 ABC transporter transmembrane protein [Nonomuraea gerenzanensis]